MAIPASHIVRMSPRVLSGGSADLETNGLFLTKNNLIPTGQPALIFTTAASVASYFGEESVEAIVAQQYFTGVNNQQTAIKELVIARRIDTDAAAWLRSAPSALTLAELKAISDGSLAITVNGSEVQATSINLSSATSFSDVAETIATKIDNVVGTYDSNTQSYTFTTEETGAEATITFASATGSGTDLSSMLGLTQAAGAVVSAGADAMTAASNMEAICNVTRNWVGFSTTWETELGEAEGFAAWADLYDDYVYFDWTTNTNVLNQLTQAQTKPAQMMGTYNCVAFLFGDYLTAAFALAVGASIAWNREQGMKVWFGKSASGITPTVTNEEQANALEAIRCSYYGLFATRNAQFRLLNTGALASGLYGYIDTLYGSIYLRNSIQRSCMDGFTSVNRVPYTSLGQALLTAWAQDPINNCLRNGVIDTTLELSESQRTQIMQEVGEDISKELFTKGYYLKFHAPTANDRSQRNPVTVTCIYTYAGSVQKADFEVLTVI